MPTPPGPALDTARRLVVERGLVRTAFERLTLDAFMTLPFEALAPTKAQLKRFFSAEPWDVTDDEALAAAVGPGEGTWRHDLAEDLTLEYGWWDGRFTVRVSTPTAAADPPGADDSLEATFDSPVVPDVTPNPRTIRFRLPTEVHGRSRWYESAASAERDVQVRRLFSEFPDVVNVLVGPDFVAVSLRRPADWERLLGPILAVVAEEFAEAELVLAEDSPRERRRRAGDDSGPRRPRRLEEAWRALGSLHPAEPEDFAVLEAAATGDDPFRRQVAANLLREAEIGAAVRLWRALVTDPVRSVRRAAVDAMVDAGREELRPLLEGALGDSDSWIRWKALRGLAELGAEPSRGAIEAHVEDPDFRVRLEATAALHAASRR